MTILPFGPNASRLMSFLTKIDVPNVVVTFVSSNSLPKVDSDFSLEKVNWLTFDQKVNPNTFCDYSLFWLISTFRTQWCSPRLQILFRTSKFEFSTSFSQSMTIWPYCPLVEFYYNYIQFINSVTNIYLYIFMTLLIVHIYY